MKALITICTPTAEGTQHWGDTAYAEDVATELTAKGYTVTIAPMDQWDKQDELFDLHIHLRGIQRLSVAVQAKKHVLWHISHPESISIDEYNQYDYVCIASTSFAQTVQKLVSPPVLALLQATSLHTRPIPVNTNEDPSVVFIGNTRNVIRESVSVAIASGYPVSIWGTGWEQFVDNKYIKGKTIAYNRIHEVYGTAIITLNDHWKDMKETGFINNRVFDVLGAGGFVISDYVPGIEDVFGDTVPTYVTPLDLKMNIHRYLSDIELRNRKQKEGFELIKDSHSFEKRIMELLEFIS